MAGNATADWPRGEAAIDAVLPPIPVPRPAELNFDAAALCGLIRHAAKANGMPPSFLARLIWKESHFDIAALSPAGA